MVGFLHEDHPGELPPFSDRLPHHLFLDMDGGILLLKQPGKGAMALGCAWSVLPRNVEVCDEHVCLDLARAHESLLRSLPMGAALQVLMPVVPADDFPAWDALHAADDADLILQSQRAAFQRGLPHRLPTSQGRLRRMATIVTLRIPLPGMSWGVGAMLDAVLGFPVGEKRGLAATLAQHQATALEQLQALRTLFDDTFLSAGHTATRLTGEQVGMVVAQALDPLETPSPVIHPHRRLAEQVLRRPADLFAEGYAVGPAHVPLQAAVLSLQRAPEQTYPGILSAPRAPADTKEPIALWHAYDGAFTIVVNVAIVDAAKEKARAERKRLIAKAHAHYSQRNKELVNELDALLGGLFLRGGQLLWGRVHLVLWAAPTDVARAADRLVLAARKLRLEFYHEQDVANTLFLQTLPLGFNPRWPKEDMVARARRVSLENLVNFLPLYGAFQGTKTPTIPFVNQRGEAVGIDFFDSDTNRHGAIVGTSGAGKSFTVTHIIHAMVSRGAAGVVMDRLESYREICAYWDGSYIELDFNNPVCLNPFYGPLDNAHVAFITAALAEMAGGGVERLDREHINVLAHAVQYFARTYNRPGVEPHLTPFVQEVLSDGCFAEDDEPARLVGKTLARKLTMYMQGLGPYAGFVDGPHTLALNPRLTVLEFSKLRNSRDLVGIIFFALMHLLRLFYTDPTRRFQPKFCIFEEAWAALRYAETAEELDEAWRTFRRLYTACISVSNVLKDFEGPTGEVIKALSAHKLFLQQEAEELAQVQEIFSLTAQEARVVGQVRKYQDFSAMYLKLGSATGGQLYLVPDPYSRWLSTQQDQEKALREQRIAAIGGDYRTALRAAVAELAAAYPFGLTGGTRG